MSQPPPLITIGKLPAKLELSAEIQSVPCKFDYTGPADISGYFIRERATDTSGRERACLRGRGLEGKQWQLPDGYEIVVLKQRNQANASVLDIEGVSTKFTQWEYDREPGERSAIAKALAYLPVAQALASDD